MSFVHTPIGADPVEFGVDADGQVIIQVLGGADEDPGGATTFISLTDTPGSYDGQAGQLVAVNGTATGLVFTDPPSGGAASWGNITGNLADQEDLQAALDGFEPAGTAASAVEAHAEETAGPHGITAFGATVIAAANAATARGLLEAAATTHNHAASQITSGTLVVARGGTGSAVLPVVLNYIGGTNYSAHLSGIDDALGARAMATIALAEIRCTFDGGGEVIADDQAETIIERATVLTAASLKADATGSAEVTVTRIRAGTPLVLGTLTLTAGDTVRVTDLSGWAATDLAAGDTLVAAVANADTITRVTLTLGRRAA